MWFLSLMIMVSCFLPLVFANLPTGIRSHHIWTTLWVLALVFIKPGIFFNKIMGLVLLNGIIVLLIANRVIWSNVPEEADRMIFLEYYELSLALSVIVYYRVERDYLGLAKLVKYSMMCIIITAVMSVIVSFINPMFARDIGGVADAALTEKEEILSFRKFGGGGYGFYSGIVCLLPILVYFYKNNEESLWGKKLLLAIIILLSVCLIRVQIFGNILVAGLIIIFSIVGSRSLGRSIFFLVLEAVLLALIPMDVYIDILNAIGSLFDPQSHIRSKFDDMALFLYRGAQIGVDTEAGIRAERFPLLWDSFSSDPFTGGKYTNHHLFWMNKLAVFGLAGIIPFVLLWYIFFRENMKKYQAKFKFFLMLGILSIVFLGVIKALFGRELWYMYFVIMPGLYYMQVLKKEKKVIQPSPSLKKNESISYK